MTHDPMREAAKNVATWLRGALDCKAWHWDADQREAAEEDYVALQESLRREAPAPSGVDSTGIDAAAEYFVRTVKRASWDGLRKDGRARDAGFEPFLHSNARQDDYRDVVREIVRLASENPASATGDLTWFWEIVDSEGFEGVPSDERDALSRIMNELRALRASRPDAGGDGVRLPKRPDGAYSQFHLDNWRDSDFAHHTGATKETLKYLLDLEAALSKPADAVNASAEARLREALDCTRRALVVLRVRLSTEPAVQGRSWINLGIMLNNAVDKADKALSAGGDEAKKSEGQLCEAGHGCIEPAVGFNDDSEAMCEDCLAEWVTKSEGGVLTGGLAKDVAKASQQVANWKPSDPTADRREIVARLVYNHSNNLALWDHPHSVLARDDAYATADVILAAIDGGRP